MENYTKSGNTVLVKKAKAIQTTFISQKFKGKKGFIIKKILILNFQS